MAFQIRKSRYKIRKIIAKEEKETELTTISLLRFLGGLHIFYKKDNKSININIKVNFANDAVEPCSFSPIPSGEWGWGWG